MRIESLLPGEVIVFGSNASGAHGAGAARFAYDRFGAVWGQGEGLQSQSYGIDTMSGLPVLEQQAHRFVDFAGRHPELRFLVTEVGCGIAGYRPEQVAQFFRGSPEERRAARVVRRCYGGLRIAVAPMADEGIDVTTRRGGWWRCFGCGSLRARHTERCVCTVLLVALQMTLGEIMVHSKRRNMLLGLTGASVLVLVTAMSAAADHTGGAELSGGELANDSCYVGGRLSGIPATLNTDDYAIRDYHGSRHLVCYFETAPSYTNGEGAEYDWDWVEPRRLTSWVANDPTCVEPGGDEIGYTDAAQSRPRFVEYRTHLVMYCSWPLDELLYP